MPQRLEVVYRWMNFWPRVTFAPEKKASGTVGGQCPIAAITSVQCLRCAKRMTTFLRLHSVNCDDFLIRGVQEPEIPNRSDAIPVAAAAQVDITNSQYSLRYSLNEHS
jgi:hypothetical protein